MTQEAIDNFVFYEVSGEKTAAFLHGQLTNNIKCLESGQGNYNLLLTQKGKIRADLWVLREGEKYVLVLPQKFETVVIDHLKALAGLSRVVITKIDFFNSPQPPLKLRGGDSGGVRGSYEHWMRAHHDEAFRIENGICLVGVDATEANLPQESRLESALHFDKGCYLGQEIIARLQYRGHVNKKLVGMKLNNNVVPPQSIHEDEKIVGHITSAVFSPTLQSPIALGYVPYDDADQIGKKFSYGEGGIAEIIGLPIK